MDDEWRTWSQSWSGPGTFAPPSSPAGGAGPGGSRRPGPFGVSHDYLSAPSFPSNVPHPLSPAARHTQVQLRLIDLLERASAVDEALRIADRYIPAALKEATGQELHAVVQGIIPGLLMALGVVAVTTAIGAAAGGIVGALVGLVGAAPGAAVGAELGLDAGLFILDILGIGFLVAYIGTNLVKAVATAGEAAKLAWQSVDHPRVKKHRIEVAARMFATAVAFVFRGVLQGVVAFLLAKGTSAAASRVGELVGKLKTSKIGAGFAEWVERNWRGLVDEPKLRPEKSGGSAIAEEGGALANLKAGGDARRTQSYQDIDAYQKKFAEKEAEARQAGENRSAGGYKAKVTEAVGERAATEYMQKNNPDFVMDKGFKPGQGFDQVYTKYDAEGNPVETMIVEAKGPGADLSENAIKGKQMSTEWVKNTVSDMLDSDDPATRALGTRLQDALDSGEPPLTGKVIQAVEGGGAIELPLKDDTVYNGGRYNP